MKLDEGTPRTAVAGNTNSVESLIRAGHQWLSCNRISMSNAKLSRLIRRFIRTAQVDQEFGAWLLCYADPTGETAVNNVMRGGAR